MVGNITGSMGDARDGMCVTDSSEKPVEEAEAEAVLSEIQIEAKMELFQRSLMDETCPSPPGPTQKSMFGFRRRMGQLEKKVQKKTFRVLESAIPNSPSEGASSKT